jgi:DNA (cytosine-5)-methyltransferase 1
MRKLKTLDLFSGIGGFSLGLERTGGFETVAFCEIEEFPRRVLAKHWPEVPCYHDVRELSAERLAADGISVDGICGGFPCQDASVANTSGDRAGIDGARTGLWSEIKRLAVELRPGFILLENVPGLLSAGFGRVLGDLAEIGYDAEWNCLPARALGLPHRRERLWVLAYPSGSGWAGYFEGQGILEPAASALAFAGHDASDAWRVLDRDLHGIRSVHGFPVSVERRRVKALGNSIVPQIPEMIGRAILAAISNPHPIQSGRTTGSPRLPACGAGGGSSSLDAVPGHFPTSDHGCRNAAE